MFLSHLCIPDPNRFIPRSRDYAPAVSVRLLINPLQRFSVTTAVPMPLSPGSICDNIQPDPYPNPAICDFLGFFSKEGSCSGITVLIRPTLRPM